MKIVIPGGSGQLGQILARHFRAHGHTVTVLSPNPRPAPLRVVAFAVEEKRAWESGGQSIYFRDPDRHLIEIATPGVWSIY